MSWHLLLVLIFAFFLILMATGMPIAFCFMVINIVGVHVFFGGTAGLEQLILNIYSSLVTFVLLPIPLFILMGEVMFHSGIAPQVIEILDKWLGRLPGRLSLLAVAAGTLFSTLTGVSIASTAMLGSMLSPDMERRGYGKSMSVGPILGSGGLAMMIPPSALAVLLGAIGEISIGRILIAIIVPGILMATLCAAYIVIRCRLQPSIAPAYNVPPTPLRIKIFETIRYVIPLGIVVFLVIGVIFLGIATPSEAAASGVFGVFFLVILHRKLKWKVMKLALGGTLRITGMVLFIIAGAKAFSQILSFSGASQGMATFVIELPVNPIMIVIFMQIVVLFLGAFMDVVAIMMITLPLFVPVIISLHFDPVWFAVIFLINIEMAMISPPFGLSLFVMKGVAPPDTTMGDIYKAALPFLGLSLLAMALVIAIPEIALWLPALMR